MLLCDHLSIVKKVCFHIYIPLFRRLVRYLWFECVLFLLLLFILLPCLLSHPCLILLLLKPLQVQPDPRIVRLSVFLICLAP